MARAAVRLGVLRLDHARDLPLPKAESSGSAGLDLRAAVAADLVVSPGDRARVPTGLVVEVPAGWEGQVRPRSGLAAKWGVTLTNSPGTIDLVHIGKIRITLSEEYF